MELEATVIIDRPASAVFALWSEAERYPEWFDVAIARRPITAGPMRVGSQYSAVDKLPLGGRIESVLEITAYKPDTYVAATLSAPFNAQWEAHFDAAGDGTRMTFKTAVRLSGLRGLLAPLLSGWASRQLREALRRFKAAAEAKA